MILMAPLFCPQLAGVVTDVTTGNEVFSLTIKVVVELQPFPSLTVTA